MAEFKNRLRMLRTNLKMSQRDLAEKLGMSKSSISMYENGSRKPDFEALEAIADFFNVDMDYLTGRKDTTHRIVEVRPDGQPLEYYEDETVQIVTNRLRTNPEFSILFKAASNVRPEDIDLVTKFVEKFSD